MAGLACATTARSLEADLQAATTDLERGKAYYEHSCDRCHALYMPRSYTAGEWKFFVRKYGRRARLDKVQRGLVYAYLRAHALPE